MIRLLLPATVAVALAATPPVHATTGTNLVNLGNNSFSVDADATTASYTQTAGALIFSNSVVLGDTLGGVFAEQNWSGYESFGLRMTLTGPNPELPFTVQFFDAAFGIINTYQGNTTGLISLTPTVVMLGLSIAGTENFSQVVGMQFTWDGDDSINTSLTEVVGFTPPTSGFFVGRAPGGVEFLTGDLENPWSTSLDTEAEAWEPPSLAALPPGSTSWALLSDRHAKTEITAIDHREVLRKLTDLPVKEWQYNHDGSRRYVGPMAQDFHEAFGLGHDDRHIATIDTDGVALAALQGLVQELQERKERSAAQASRLAALAAELETLREQLAETLPPTE